MPSSKIIKACRNAKFERFEFCEIDAGSENFSGHPVQGGNDLGADGQGPTSPPRTAEELEDVIRKRLLEVERQAQEIEKTAYEKGYAQGQKDGFEYGQKSAQIIAEQIQNLLLQLQELPGKVLRDYRDWLLDTCLKMSRKVVQRELASDPEAIRRLVENLVNEAEKTHGLTVFLSPKDHELLIKHGQFNAWIENLTHSFAITPDASLQPGGCRLESDNQVLDASIETQFLLMEEVLEADISFTGDVNRA